MLLDLGRSPAPADASTGGQLWAESRLEGKQPASACDAISLHMLAGDGADFSSDGLARAWFGTAHQYWGCADYLLDPGRQWQREGRLDLE